MECWFTSSSLFGAAQNDLLHERLSRFSKYHKKFSKVGLTILQRHHWYLTEELVPLSPFNSNISEEVQNSIAEKISSFPTSTHLIQKPCLPAITPKSSLPDYIGPRSTVLFSLIDVSHSFLADPQ